MRRCLLRTGLLLAVVLGTVVPAASPFAHAQDKQEPAISAAEFAAELDYWLSVVETLKPGEPMPERLVPFEWRVRWGENQEAVIETRWLADNPPPGCAGDVWPAWHDVLDDYREQTSGRFDDLSSRLVELDRQLREIAHSLETKSVISRPMGEILHREVEGFAERSGVHVDLEIRGDPDSLSSAQRITVFRAIQEALANIREHAGATNVSVRVRARRSAIELQVVDDGIGFEVERALARAAQRGRLGLVGIGERVRMVGGTFELESAPGGPTTLKLTLPRWEPLTPP